TYPKIAKMTSHILIERVELNRDTTVVDFIVFTPGYSIGGGSVLKVGDKSYKALSSSIGFDQYQQGEIGKPGKAKVCFEPLPKDTEIFDYEEGDCEGCFKVLGVEIPKE
ncbi:MAG: hypothetical protein Q4C30_06385, partial [Bacteroidia bacterium]|nr:hypothetical protein [Bacteroidia bacterium]